MIQLILRKAFKSLKPFSKLLPDFTILTGLNGAGKTQILIGANEEKISVSDASGKVLTNKKYVDSSTLSPNDSIVVTKEQLDQTIKNLWSNIQNFQKSKKTNPNYQLEQTFGQKNPQVALIRRIEKSSGKQADEFSADDIYENYPLDDGLNQTDIFYQNFSNLFKRYQDKHDDNEYRQYRNEVKGHKTVSYLTEIEFTKKYGEAPWDFVNKIISEANLDYIINSPVNSHRDAPFELKLINKSNQAEINFGDLSSGEKVLMSLALALYNSTFDMDFPDVLLMDEPDASLHPSMVKQFLDVIQNVFVKEKKVKVIITTHSPSTVALAPEESIHTVKNSGDRLIKSSKDEALKLLTSGVPSLSINHENRRQVFVESPNDVIYFEKLYNILTSKLNPEISLSFISSGESRTDKNGIKVSNCEQVENITNILRDAGNNLVWGIIDWDSKDSNGNEFVKILGNKKRYSIENYIFDPLVLGALLLREKLIEKSDVGLNDNETYIDLRSFNSDRLQKISDFVIAAISKKVKKKVSKSQSCNLMNGKSIDIPNWYLHYQGHDLEKIILDTYPQLNQIKKNKEEVLKNHIIDKVIEDLEGLISVDILEVFKSIQSS